MKAVINNIGVTQAPNIHPAGSIANQITIASTARRNCEQISDYLDNRKTALAAARDSGVYSTNILHNSNVEDISPTGNIIDNTINELRASAFRSATLEFNNLIIVYQSLIPDIAQVLQAPQRQNIQLLDQQLGVVSQILNSVKRKLRLYLGVQNTTISGYNISTLYNGNVIMRNAINQDQTIQGAINAYQAYQNMGQQQQVDSIFKIDATV